MSWKRCHLSKDLKNIREWARCLPKDTYHTILIPQLDFKFLPGPLGHWLLCLVPSLHYYPHPCSFYFICQAPLTFPSLYPVGLSMWFFPQYSVISKAGGNICGYYSFFVMHMGTLKASEVNWLVQRHVSDKWQSWDQNPVPWLQACALWLYNLF